MELFFKLQPRQLYILHTGTHVIETGDLIKKKKKLTDN